MVDVTDIELGKGDEPAAVELDDREVRRTFDRLLGLMWGLTHPKAERHAVGA